MSKSQSKRGRPKLITPEVVAKLVEGFKNDFTVEEACRYARIGKDCYYDERKANQAFCHEMDQAQDFPLILAKKEVVKFISQPGVVPAVMALKFLERRQRDRYAVKQVPWPQKTPNNVYSRSAFEQCRCAGATADG